VDLLDGAVQMDGGLIVDVHHHRTKFGGLLDVTFGTLNHIMHVERFGTGLRYRLKDGEAEGDVGDERTVHHVEVKPVCLTAIDHIDVAVEMEEVGSE
jgi:hypothetical protein